MLFKIGVLPKTETFAATHFEIYRGNGASPQPSSVVQNYGSTEAVEMSYYKTLSLAELTSTGAYGYSWIDTDVILDTYYIYKIRAINDNSTTSPLTQQVGVVVTSE